MQDSRPSRAPTPDLSIKGKMLLLLSTLALALQSCAPMSTVAESATGSPTNPKPENTIGPMPSAVPTGNEIGPSPLPSFTPESIIPATPIAEVPSFIMDAVDESVRAYPLPSMIRGLGDYQVLSENGFAGVTVANGEAYRNSVAYPISMIGPDGSVYELDEETNEDNLRNGFVAYKGQKGYLVFVNGMPVEEGVTHVAATDPSNQGEVVVLKVKNGEVVGEDRNRVLEVESLDRVLFDSDGAVFVIQGETVLELKVGARKDVATPEPTATDTPEPTATTAATATVPPTFVPATATVVFTADVPTTTPVPPVVGGEGCGHLDQVSWVFQRAIAIVGVPYVCDDGSMSAGTLNVGPDGVCVGDPTQGDAKTVFVAGPNGTTVVVKVNGNGSTLCYYN